MSGTSGSETRQLKKGVFVRFTDAQLALLQDAATHQGVSVPQLLRDRSLSPEIERAAS
ncbi:MAG: hypothetical protein AB1925_18730 [Actinomycetota bacterium]